MRNSYFESVIISFEHESIEKLPCIQHQWCHDHYILTACEHCFLLIQEKNNPSPVCFYLCFSKAICAWYIIFRIKWLQWNSIYFLIRGNDNVNVGPLVWGIRLAFVTNMHCSVSLSVCTIDSYILHNSAAASALRGHLAYEKWVHECAHNVESIGKARYTLQLFFVPGLLLRSKPKGS